MSDIAGIKPGIAIILVNGKTKEATRTKNFIKDKVVVVPILVKNKEITLKVLKVFKYLIRKNVLKKI